MKLTPLEIQKKEFRKSFRGYNEDEVTEYLNKISKDYEELYRENREFEEKIGFLNERLKDYKNMEQTLKDAILMAQKTAEEVKNNAQKEKQLIIEQAVAKAAKIIDEAKQTFNRIKNQNDELKRQFSLYKTRFINFLESQYDLINSYHLDIDGISEGESKAFLEVAASRDDKNKIKNQKIKDINSVESQEEVAIQQNRGEIKSNIKSKKR